MGQYKVPQNVEAEDKIIGPLTFKQFVYALIGFGAALLSFILFKSLPVVMIIVGAPPTILFLLLAFYTRDGQNFEQLLIAMVGFFANSRKRLWRKEEIIESFHIEPKKVIAEQSQRNPAEVRSELEKLATLIDSRGWNQPAPAETNLAMPTPHLNDRLIAPTAPAHDASQPKASEDILDLQHSPLAKNLAELIEEAAVDVRQEAIEQMQAMHTAAGRRQATATAAANAATAATAQSISGVTTPSQDDILKLATERDDLTVSQLASTAGRIAPLEPGQSVELRSNGSASR